MAAATSRPRRASLPAPLLGLLAAAALIACAADGDSKKRSGPPGGGVDPSSISSDNLSMGGQTPSGPERVDAPGTADPATGAVDVPSPSTPSPFPQMGTTSAPAAGTPSNPQSPTPSATPAAGAKPAATKAGGAKMTVTAAHCQQMGKKLAQLAIGAGGGQAQADAIGNQFTSSCMSDQIGQQIDKREFDCIIGMKSIGELPACKDISASMPGQ